MCIRDRYIEGVFAPSELVQLCKELTSQVNVVRRICDPHEGWYLLEASKAGIKPNYISPYAKNQNRKIELIKGLQQKLGSKLRISPMCDKLITEFEECRWAETGDTPRIVNSSRFHLLDTAQYFADLIPKYAGNILPSTTWYDDLRQKNTARIKANEKAEEKKKRQHMKVFKRSVKKKRTSGNFFGRILK